MSKSNAEFEDYESFSPTMTRDEIMDWFYKRLGRVPEAADVYKIAREFYQIGAFSRALVCLQQYVGFSTAQIAGRHLLGYCYLALGETENALTEFTACAAGTYPEDWQMVVELSLELEEKKKSKQKGPWRGSPVKSREGVSTSL